MRAPGDACLRKNLKMVQRDLPLLADPGCRRGELFEVCERLNRVVAIDRGGELLEVVVQLKLHAGHPHQLVERLVELLLLGVDVGNDLVAKRLLRVGYPVLVGVERRAVVVEHLLERAGLLELAHFQDALELRRARVVVEDGEVLEARLGARTVGVLEGEVVGNLKVLAVALKRVAGVDREELAVYEALVLPAPADGIAVGRHEEERLEPAERLGIGALRAVLVRRRHGATVLEHAILHVLVALGELRREHQLGVAVGILAAHNLKFLRGNSRDARQVVRKRLGDGAGGDGVGRRRRLKAVYLAELAVLYALGAHERTRVRGFLREDPVAFVVVELDDAAIAEVLEYGRHLVEFAVGPVRVLWPDAHHRVADLREELRLDLLENVGLLRAREVL